MSQQGFQNIEIDHLDNEKVLYCIYYYNELYVMIVLPIIEVPLTEGCSAMVKF